jgi:type IV secretory pathway VirB10-like protein
LNDPTPGRSARKRASLSIDPHSAPGSNLDYLLDEEEPQHHWGIGKILLILIALALAVGFGYLRFKNQGLAWLNGLKKPTATVTQGPSTPDSTNAPAPSPSITPEVQPPAQPAASTPQPATPNPAIDPSGTAPVTPGPVTPPPATPPPSDAAKSTDTAPATAPEKAAAPADKDSTATPEKDSAAAKDTEPEPSAAAAKPVEKPKPAPKPATPKPSAATKPTGYDPVAESQKYLYGHGASQDCDRGMRLLKPAANQGNPKAMVEMGALYSAGLCTPRDLPTAYRWFAIALRKDPENTAIQADLSKLWGEMTQPERQLAIKLTQ